ncbi:hypothetical protein [Paenibacillus elgii]|uniref:hypothetical protein n=1 Tax=Paenibacillus elgii TaxID=189691 RepID=UPI000248CFAC|nr:hypothetical protein [Paenibacillus elgii]
MLRTYNFTGGDDYFIVRMKSIPSYDATPRNVFDYVIIFKFKQQDDNCLIELNLVNKKSIDLFELNSKNVKYIEYTGGSLKINEFIEIKKVPEEFQTNFIATVSNVIIKRNDLTHITNLNILLFTDYTGKDTKRLNVGTPSSFSPLFQVEYRINRLDIKIDENYSAITALRNIRENNYQEVINALQKNIEKLELEQSFLINEYQKLYISLF